MRILGIDYGDARIGLALSDASATLCGRAWTLTEWNLERAVAAIADVVHAEGVERIVLGLPKNMDGSEGFRVDATHEFADALKTIYDGEIVFWDERLSSVGAARFLNETNTRGKKRKDVLDTVAACIILDGYLSSQKNK